MTLFPLFSPVSDILWAYALFVVPNIVIHWLPKSKTKNCPVFTNTLVFYKVKDHILRSYLCVVHINWTPLCNIMMLCCKILFFLLLYLSLFCFNNLAQKSLVRQKPLWLWWFLVAGVLNRKFHHILKLYLDETMSCSELELWSTVTTSSIQIHSEVWFHIIMASKCLHCNWLCYMVCSKEGLFLYCVPSSASKSVPCDSWAVSFWPFSNCSAYTTSFCSILFQVATSWTGNAQRLWAQ